MSPIRIALSLVAIAGTMFLTVPNASANDAMMNPSASTYQSQSMNTNASYDADARMQNQMPEERGFWSRLFNRSDARGYSDANSSNYANTMDKRQGMMYKNQSSAGMHYGHKMGMDKDEYFEAMAEEWKRHIGLSQSQEMEVEEIEAAYVKDTEEMQKNISRMKNEMMTYMGSEDLEEDRINTMIDELSDAKRDLMKRRVNYYFEIEEFLTEDQVAKSREFWSDHMRQANQHMEMMKERRGGMMKQGSTMPEDQYYQNDNTIDPEPRSGDVEMETSNSAYIN